MKIHPAADWLPTLPESEFQELRRDIAERGQRELVLVKDGFILDGRHRYRAWRELGREPMLREYDGDGDIIAEIASRNLFRRNLTPQQRAELVVKMCGEKLRADARERQRSGLKTGDKIPVPLKSAPRGETAERIASIAKVGRDTARKALRVHGAGISIPAEIATVNRAVELDTECFRLVAFASTASELAEKLSGLPPPPYRELLM